MTHAQSYKERQAAAAQRIKELQDELLVELAKGRRGTIELAQAIGADRMAVYRALLLLVSAGKVSLQKVRSQATWALAGTMNAAPRPIPPRDPLLWALFGAQP